MGDNNNSDTNESNLTNDDLPEETRGDQKAEQVNLAEDNDRPAAPPQRPDLGSLPKDHPSTDTGMDKSEVYEESEEGIAYTPTNPDVSTDEDKREGLEEGKKL